MARWRDLRGKQVKAGTGGRAGGRGIRPLLKGSVGRVSGFPLTRRGTNTSRKYIDPLAIL